MTYADRSVAKLPHLPQLGHAVIFDLWSIYSGAYSINDRHVVFCGVGGEKKKGREKNA